MPLSLVVGPANAGKVALLLERYLARLDDEPYLIVPNRADVARVERDLLRRAGCLLGGSIGTFDDLFAGIASADPGSRPVATRAQRTLVAARAVQVIAGGEPTGSARFSGFTDSLLGAFAELEGGLLQPSDLEGDIGALLAAYHAGLDALGLWDRDLLRRSACERLLGDLGSWHGEPVFAYGFEDLTAAEWSVLEALAGRADVHVSLPYEPGRAAFASLSRTAGDLASLAGGRIDELPPGSAEYAAPALALLERGLFEPGPGREAQTGGAVRFLAGAGVRGTLELVADHVLAEIRAGTSPEEVGVLLPSVDRWRDSLETVFAALEIPYGIEAPIRFPATPLGHALLALLQFAWGSGGRRTLYSYLRSPYSGIPRAGVDFAEGRLRGRAVDEPGRVEEETERLREAPLVALRELRDAHSPIDGVRSLLASMTRSAYGLDAPQAGDQARLDLATYGAATDLLDELAALESRDMALSERDILEALRRVDVRPGPAAAPGRVAVLDLMRARTRRFDTVFVLGLEEGSLPRRPRTSPFLDDDARSALGARLERPDQVSRDRYLFYTACTRASRRLYLVRQAATDDGSPLEASPFWYDAREVFGEEEAERATSRRALSQLTWPLEAAPTDRERLRALVRLSAVGETAELATALADANGWTRRLDRARRAFIRDARLRNPAVLAQLGGRTVFAATELERFVDCSSAWLFERVVDPKKIDAEADALLRGKLAHQALYAFYSGLPRELGADRVTPGTLEAALAFLERCLDDAISTGVRIELGPVDSAELRESLHRDLARFVRAEAESAVPFEPRRFELGFGTDRSAPELQRGLELGGGLFLSGKIDRIDIDPLSARGIVQDYKSGKGSFSAREIDEERRLQVPLYMLVLRDLAGIEPLGGLYRALSGARAARGMLRASARDELPGFKPADYLDEEQFWGQVETARERALGAAQRIRAGDVAHDPKGGECPTWCDLWTMCRVARS
jgi:hypothetical protein